jgi:hypothetical protein
VEVGEEDREGGIEYDHQENGLNHRQCRAAADAFGTARDRQPFVAADQRDADGEERCLEDTEPEAPKRDRALQLAEIERERNAELESAHDGAAEQPHHIGIEGQQRQADDQRQDARNDQNLDRIEAKGADGVDLLVHHHGADLGGKGAARAAGDDDGRQQRAELAQEGDAEQIDGIDLGAELAELVGALESHHHADQEGQ